MSPDERVVVVELVAAAGAYLAAETLENGSRLVREQRRVEEALAEKRHGPGEKGSQ